MESISAIGMFAAGLYAFLLFNKNEKTISDRILIVWMFLFILHLLLPFMMSLGNSFFIEKVNGLDIGFYTLHFTFLYYYSLNLADNSRIFKPGHLWLLLPTATVYLVQCSIDAHVELFSEIVELGFSGSDTLFHLTGVVTLNLVFCIYFCRKIFLVFRGHQRRIKDNYSFSEHVDLQWLLNLGIAALVLTVIVFLYLIALLYGRLNEEWLNNLYFSSISIFVLFLGYRGYKQTDIRIYTREKSQEKKKENGQSVQIAENALTPEGPETEEVGNSDVQSVLSFMVKEKPYLDPNLNIGSVANSLGMHAHQFSRLLNRELNQNFFEFVNNYRVQEFKSLVADPKNQHYSILGLALDAGFNSKATFNRIFKNATGQTPSHFRSNYKVS